MTASNPTPVRQRRPRILAHSAFCLLTLVAALASPARALEVPYPPEITPPADLPGLPSALVVEDSVPAAAAAAAAAAPPESNLMMGSHNHQELRLRHRHRHRHRHMHLHRRQKDEDDGEDKDGGKGGSGGDKSEDKDEEEDDGKGKGGGDKSEGETDGGKTESKDADKTQTADGEKETDKVSTSPPSPDDDKDGKEDKDDEGDKDEDKDKESTSDAPTKTATDDPASSTSTSESTSTATEDADDEDTPLPVPFDGTAPSEFKSSGDADESCPDFISSLLSSDTFNDCYPISMLILKSNGFFDAKRLITSMVRVLDAGCAADVDSCSDFMRTAAQDLTAEANCKEEYDDGVTAVTEAYNGLMNYKIVYSATCLQDPETDQYCYASAVTNSSDSSDSYLYFLPYNLTLPAASTPGCSWCNKETMDIFHAASSNRKLPISDTYEDAARQMNDLCDPDWVNGTLPEAVEDAGPALLPSWALVAASVALVGALESLL